MEIIPTDEQKRAAELLGINVPDKINKMFDAMVIQARQEYGRTKTLAQLESIEE